jgi:trehalose 6-phosphate phosphatase
MGRAGECMSVAELNLGLGRPPKGLLLRDVALFLDLDGTLAPIVARPQDVRPDPRRTNLLERLKAGLNGRLAVISGRTLGEIDHILEGRATAVAAIHGLIRRDARGVVGETPQHAGMAEALNDLAAFAQADPGLLVEDKTLSLALHYRLAPQFASGARALADRIAAETGLIVQAGDMVVELRTPGPNKGDSVSAFMSEAPFEGALPIFIGDDLTDEAGFRAAAALGGYGVLVGPQRRTAATFGIADVDGALDWLEAAR